MRVWPIFLLFFLIACASAPKPEKTTPRISGPSAIAIVSVASQQEEPKKRSAFPDVHCRDVFAVEVENGTERQMFLKGDKSLRLRFSSKQELTVQFRLQLVAKDTGQVVTDRWLLVEFGDKTDLDIPCASGFLVDPGQMRTLLVRIGVTYIDEEPVSHIGVALIGYYPRFLDKRESMREW